MDACAPTRGVVRLDVGGGRLGGNAEGKKSFRLAFFFHAATQTSTARQRVASTRKREATSRQSTEVPLKLTVEAAGRSGTLSIFLSIFLAIFWHRSDQRVPLLLETFLFGVSDWSMWDGKARVN